MQSTPSAYVIFLMQDSRTSQSTGQCTWSPVQNIIRLANWSAKHLQVKNTDISSSRVAVHVEILIVYAESQCSFATYADRSVSSWQDFDPSFYTAEDWIAVPLCRGYTAVATLVQKCQDNVRSPYSFSRYLCSTHVFSWIVHVLDDRDNAPAHCGGLTARVLKRIGVLHEDEFAPTFSPQKLLNTLRVRKPVDSITKSQQLDQGSNFAHRGLNNRMVTYVSHTQEENQEAYFSSIWLNLRMSILRLKSPHSPTQGYKSD